LAKIPDETDLLSNKIVKDLNRLKKDLAGSRGLNVEEVLIALSISHSEKDSIASSLGKLKELRNCEIHSTHLPGPEDESGLTKLGVNLTSDCRISKDSLFRT